MWRIKIACCKSQVNILNEKSVRLSQGYSLQYRVKLIVRVKIMTKMLEKIEIDQIQEIKID